MKALSILVIIILSILPLSASTDRAEQEMWLAEVNKLLCAEANACNGTERDSLNHPYVYTYVCCVENAPLRFDCSNSCLFTTAGIVPWFYHSGLTPHEAFDVVLKLKAVPDEHWSLTSIHPLLNEL